MREEIKHDFSRRERKTKTPEQALASLMRLCARAEKSSGDALRLMSGWGVQPDDARKVLEKLLRERFIDDERYAAAYVREKSGLNGWGTHKIRRMLVSKGVARAVIDSALAAVDKGVSAERLREMLGRKMRAVKTGDKYELRGKLLRYGLGLGYDYEQVQDAVEQLVK